MGNNKLTSKQTCGVVILAGLIFNLIAFFGADISIAKENHIYMYLFIDLLFIAGFGLAGYALYKDQGDDLLKMGIYIVAAGYLLKFFKVASWIISNHNLYGSFYGAGKNFVYIIGIIAGLAGFILFGLLLTRRSGRPLFDNPTVVMVLLAVNLGLETIYALMLYSSGSYDGFFKFLWQFITGQAAISTNYVSIIGIIMYITYLNQQGFPSRTLSSGNNTLSSVNNTMTGQPANNIPANSVPAAGTPDNNKMSSEEMFSLLRRYKELLDMDIITQEEFEAKKKELL